MNKIITKDEAIYEIARDFCRLTCSCEECSLVGTRNRDKCKAKVYARRAYDKGYSKRHGLPINFTLRDEDLQKIKDELEERIELDVRAIRIGVSREIFHDIREILENHRIGFSLKVYDEEMPKLIEDLEKKYLEGKK